MCTFFRFVNRRDILHTSLSTHTPRSLITPLSPQVPHFHRNSPLSHHTTHSPILLLFTTQHTLHSPLSRHTLSTLSPHNPHPLTTPISQHTLPSVTTNSYILFLTTCTPHSLYSLDAPHTSNFHIKTLSPLTPTIISHHTLPTLSTHHTLQTLSPHHTLPILSTHTLHFLTTHSPLSRRTLPTIVYHSLIPLPTLSPYHTIPTVSPHTPISHLTSYFRTSLISHLTPHSLTTLPTILLHFILSYKSQISFPTLEPHFATAHSHFHYALHSFTTLPHFSLYSSLSSHLIPNVSLSTFLSHSLYSLTTTPVPREDIEMRDGGVVCEHCIQGKYSPTFYFPFRLRCQRANLGLGEFQCFNFSL